MRQLNFDLKQLQRDRSDGSYRTRAGRSFALAQMANTLHELGYRRLRRLPWHVVRSGKWSTEAGPLRSTDPGVVRRIGPPPWAAVIRRVGRRSAQPT